MDTPIEETQVTAETTETPVETSTTEVAAETTASNPWENFEFKLPEADEAEADVAVSTEEVAPVPTEAVESPNPSEGETAVEEDDIEAVLAEHDPNKPIPLSRKQKLELGKTLIEPFRDPSTPIEDVYNALTEFHPTRTQELAQTLVNASLEAYPDAYLKQITGLDVTVADIQRLVSEQGSGTPLNTAPTDELSEAVKALTEVYGDEWRDAANDGNLLTEDLPLIRAIRSQLGATDAKDAQIKALEDKIKSLEPEIDSIKQAKEAEYEAKKQEIFNADVDKLRSTIETKAFPAVFEKLNLTPKESDSEDVKAVKNLISTAFKPQGDYASAFDTFLETGFSKREEVGKAMQRIGDAFTQAANLEAQALRNPKQANELKTQANALRSNASREQDALTVWAQNAANEFISTQYAPVLRLLEENAQLKLSKGGRTEIVGNSVAGAGKDWRTEVKEFAESGRNPFDAVADRFAAINR